MKADPCGDYGYHAYVGGLHTVDGVGEASFWPRTGPLGASPLAMKPTSAKRIVCTSIRMAVRKNCGTQSANALFAPRASFAAPGRTRLYRS